MKLLLVTPLYPPDIGDTARYVKELAERLSPDHEVTVLLYGRLPEYIRDVHYICVDKRKPLFIRLARFTIALRKAFRGADVVYAENGPSVELPLSLATLFTKKSFHLHIGDTGAHAYAQKHLGRRLLERLIYRRAKHVFEDFPDSRPEILPFSPFPKEKVSAYEASWKTHIGLFEEEFSYD